MKKMPQPIPYQGSKRNIAKQILSFFPSGIDTLVEPFAGSAALSVRAAYMNKAKRFYLNDLNKPLIDLLEQIINHPQAISEAYSTLWHEQLGREREFYDEVRSEFNQTKRPDLFLYLLARCVKASVRYNANGEFNQAPDNRRKGRNPNSMQDETHAVSQLLKGRTMLSSHDFHAMLDTVNAATDLVYMDPPYQGTSGRRDSRYCSGVEIERLVEFIEELNVKNVMFIISYDGRKGPKTYGQSLPEFLNLTHLEIEAGRSTQATLMGENEITYESLYLSAPLVDCLNLSSNELQQHLQKRETHTQLELTFA